MQNVCIEKMTENDWGELIQFRGFVFTWDFLVCSEMFPASVNLRRNASDMLQSFTTWVILNV